MRDGGENPNKIGLDVLQQVVKQFPRRTRGNNQPVLAGQRGKDLSHLRIVSYPTQTALDYGGRRSQAKIVEPVFDVIPLKALFADPVVLLKHTYLGFGKIEPVSAGIERGDGFMPYGLAEIRRYHCSLSIERDQFDFLHLSY